MVTERCKFFILALVFSVAYTSLAAPIKFRPAAGKLDVRAQIDTAAPKARWEAFDFPLRYIMRRLLLPKDGDTSQSGRSSSAIDERDPLTKETIITNSITTLDTVHENGNPSGKAVGHVHVKVTSTTNTTIIVEHEHLGKHCPQKQSSGHTGSQHRPCACKHHGTNGRKGQGKGRTANGKKCGGAKVPKNPQNPSTTTSCPTAINTSSRCKKVKPSENPTPVNDPFFEASASDTTTTTTNKPSSDATGAPQPKSKPDVNFDPQGSLFPPVSRRVG